MPYSPNAFLNHSSEVARAFLQTVVFLDDHAFDQPKPESIPEGVELVEPTGPLAEDSPVAVPGRSAEARPATAPASAPPSAPAATGAVAGGAPAVPPETTPAISDKAPDRVEGLDAKSTIEAFAKRDLICAVLQPDMGGDLSAIKEAARRADVVALDWVIHRDPGGVTSALVGEILADDHERGGRLRLIAIYTIEADLEGIVSKLREVLATSASPPQPDGQFALQNRTCRLVVLAKPGSMTPAHQQVVAPERLPERMHQEFAKLSMGIIRNVALRGLAILRDNTHELLAYLGRDLDAAFVGHRVLLPDPDDAQEHAVELVGTELTAMLHGFDAAAEASASRILSWLHYHGREYELAFNLAAPRRVSVQDLEPMLTKGVSAWNEPGVGANKIDSKRREFFRQATSTFVPVAAAARAEVAETSDLNFAVATSLTRRYDKRRPRPDEDLPLLPMLRLGTIIANDTGQPRRYLVCIQPLCDCVRLNDAEDTKFAFLEGKPVPAGKQFDIVLEEGPANFQRLKLDEKIFNVHVEFFRSRGKVVRSIASGQGFYFTAGSGPFRWIGQLKDAYALRIAQRFASDVSRVGLNESEWLRRWAGGRSQD